MPLTLITGPANAGKAELVMSAMRRHLAAGHDPLLVVPTRADVERYRAELAGEGALLGGRVLGFRAFLAEVVARAGRDDSGGAEPLGAVARERLLGALATRVWGGGAGRSRAMARALEALVGELEVARVTPARLTSALESWTLGEPLGAPRAAAARRSRELARLYGDYRAALAQLGRADAELAAMAALDELRRRPALWGAVPVLFYGFDDLTPLQLDAIESLATVVDAPVTVSLGYEPGRVVFAGRAGAFHALEPLASQHVRLPARAGHYAPRSRAALHHLERALFEPREPSVRAPAGRAVRLLEGGSERAELELVAAEVRALLERGLAPGEIAIVHRAPAAVAELLGEVFSSFAIPFSLERRRPLRATVLGGALLALLRCAFDGAEEPLPAPAPASAPVPVPVPAPAPAQAEDLVRWLRAPGVLEVPALADRLEARVRRAGGADAERARALWEAERWPLDPIHRLREARDAGPRELIDRICNELDRLFAAPRRRRAAVLTREQLDDARAFAAARGALEQLRALAAAVPELLGGAAGLMRTLGELDVVCGDPPSAREVAVLAPLALRARRVRALFLCGLQQGVFPALPRPEPLLGAERRRRIRELSGLPLAGERDALADERHLLYAAVSRPEELLVLSWHTDSDDGVATSPSLFLADVCDLFEESL
ncbi:MAG: hypothetical protein FWD42_08705, partial [Solirubrobacterales bacterium]|nr:hypothetical protein [Solirubrobacterales bacterium]